MASVLPKSVEEVIKAFEKLPGIGPKSAARMAYYFLAAPPERSIDFAKALVYMKRNIVNCNKCFNVADSDPCLICSDKERNTLQLCVVESPLDVVAIEKSGIYKGLYHVLGGVISPADGIGPEHIRMDHLKKRLQQENKEDAESDNKAGVYSGEKELEVIVATNPNLEGEATAAYIIEMIKGINANIGIKEKIKVSRLAMGLPTGADLEYADRLTLKRALEGRTVV